MLDKQINSDYVAAMKAKDADKVATINFLRAQIKNVKIDKKCDELKDEEVIAVIKKQVKQRQDSIEQFTKGGREDLAEKEAQELAILKEYLPEEMPAEEVEGIVAAVIAEVGASSLKDMGKVMKEVVSKVAGRADGKMVSELVKKKLSEH